MKISLRLAKDNYYQKINNTQKFSRGKSNGQSLQLKAPRELKWTNPIWRDPNHRIKPIQKNHRKQKLSIPSLELKCLRNAKVHSSGMILNEYNEILSESIIEWDSLTQKSNQITFDLEDNKINQELKNSFTYLSISRRIEQASILFLSSNSTNYSHWLYEAFARACVFSELNFPNLKDLRIIIDNVPSAFTANSDNLNLLSLIGIDASHLEYIKKGEWLFFDCLYVPSRVVDLAPNRNFVMPEAVKFLSDLSCKNKSVSSPYGKLVYIGRSELDNIIIKNEEDIEAQLAKLGFDIVLPDQLSLPKKIATFANADLVIGAFGNGMANIPFLPQGSRVIFLTTSLFFPAFNYQTMLCSINNNPAYIIVESDSYTPKKKSPQESLGYFSTIDVDLLLKLTQEIMDDMAISPANMLAKPMNYFLPPKDSESYKFEIKKHLIESSIDLPGINYKKHLDYIHKRLKPKTYLEIGVETGASITSAKPPTIAVGVDPNLKIKYRLDKNIQLFEMTSDEFFSSKDFKAQFDGQELDLAFLDGLHEFDQTLRDFINVEKYSHESTVVLFHDVLPLNRVTASRTRKTGFWSGDVYKLVLILAKYRPDLNVSVIPTAPTGLGIATNLNPKSTLLDDRFDEIVQEYLEADFDDLLGNNKWEALNVMDKNDLQEVARLYELSCS